MEEETCLPMTAIGEEFLKSVLETIASETNEKKKKMWALHVRFY